jgi:hypothetical protein
MWVKENVCFEEENLSCIVLCVCDVGIKVMSETYPDLQVICMYSVLVFFNIFVLEMM